MAIFPIIKADSKVQINDKIRISGVESFRSKGESAVTLVEIEPEAAAGFIDVTGTTEKDLFLDWAYSGTSRTVTSSLRITTDGSPVTLTLDIDVVTAADDDLFSSDNGIISHESEILSLLPAGRSSFLYQHRKAKQLILDWFDEMGFCNSDGSKISSAEITDKEEVRKWSEAWTLALIYKDASNSIGDKFEMKSDDYKTLAIDARKRALFRLDLNKDGSTTLGEHVQIGSMDLIRR